MRRRQVTRQAGTTETATKGEAIMKRRDVLAAGLTLAAGSTLAAPAIAQTQPSIRWRLTSSFPKEQV